MGAKGWFAVTAILIGNAVTADPAKVMSVKISGSPNNSTFSVTLKHADTGWEDYADGWRVELANGEVLGTRVLHHPHVNEQPFTRSLSGVSFPEGTIEVFVRAKTLTEGWGKTTFSVPIN